MMLTASLLFGCRAFEPEVVVVNRPPDTFIMGSPAETTGAYFHFHVYWYGTDTDGVVERFVWALTDTSIQDHDTDDDEEDQRFNPALNISTLEIGRWTTRTDSVFNFSLHQGSVLAYDMTLHLVAVDDRGDFDRTPARLYFISNALGNPQVIFHKQLLGRADSVLFANEDTIAYGEPFTLTWTGQTPNIRSFTQEMLVAADTVPEGLPPEAARDGLLGFKYRLPEVVCDESREDCWNPRRYNDATGDSVSYFGDVQKLEFTNDDQASDVFHQRLASGIHSLLVNTIDVAGVEVPLARQELRIVVNYDPETRLLRGETDPLPQQLPSIYNYDDPHVYPYYLVYYPGGIVEEYPFAEDARVPDRSYVVFKALGRDDPRDLKVFPDSSVTFQSLIDATGLYNLTAPYNFRAEYGETHRTGEWEPDYAVCDTCWSADTLGFFAGPFEHTFNMRTVDEHDKRDGTADTFHFFGNNAPCVQCVDLLNLTELYDPGAVYDCEDQDCQADVDTLVAANGTPAGHHLATLVDFFQQIYFKLATGEVWLERPLQLAEVDSVVGHYYAYRVLLYGQDDPQEPALLPEDRIMSWRYAIVGENDSNNNIRDGAGADNLNLLFPTRQFSRDSSDPIYIDDDGVWILTIRFFVPFFLLLNGSQAYWDLLFAQYLDTELTDRAFALSTIQLGAYESKFVARDASNDAWRPDNSIYHYYRGVRPPLLEGQGNPLSPHLHRKSGDIYDNELGHLLLDFYAFESPEFVKRFHLKVLSDTGELFPE